MSTIEQSSKQRSFSVVHHNTLNFSTAQHKFSFGKGRRFTSLGLNTPTDFTMTLQSTIKSSRSPTFGIGNRFKQPRHSSKSHRHALLNRIIDNTPPPGSYTLKTSFDGESPTIKKNHLTTIFRIQSNRQQQDNVYLPGAKSSKAVRLVPGPGAYDFKNLSMGQNGYKFTIKSRVKNNLEPVEIAKKMEVPGPGAYKTLEISKDGKYCLSTVPNSKAGVWSPPTC